MLTFPINWTLSKINVSGISSGQYRSELNLNDEWTVYCIWKECEDKVLKPHYIEITRQTFSDDIYVSGILGFRIDYMPHGITFRDSDQQDSSILAFTKVMESGSNLIALHFSCVPYGAVYYLYGIVKIMSIIEIYGFNWADAECNKCLHMKSLEELSNEFESLLDPDNCCFSDVNLKCGSTSIPAHKAILSARSPAFAVMFRNPKKENHESEVDVTDLDISVVRLMLTYIYSGKTPNLTVSSASGLLLAADKYMLQDLKRVCGDFLKDNITLENVLSILVLGFLYNGDLKSSAVDYICKEVAEFSVLEETEDWKAIRKERPALAISILLSVVKSREKKYVGNISQEVEHNTLS